MGRRRGGGYYLDVGASRLVIDGKIKLKNDSQIARFDKKSIVFENGSELPADVVIFATGYVQSNWNFSYFANWLYSALVT